MKKLLLIAVSILTLLLVSVYLFIPSTIKVSKVFTVKASLGAVSRCLGKQEGWQKWFPHQQEKAASYFFRDNNVEFSNIKSITENVANVLIETNNIVTNANINIVPLKSDSMLIAWSCNISAGNNPFKRVNAYLKAITIKKSMDELTEPFKIYIEDFKNAYGFTIRITRLQDSSMIALKATINKFPTVLDIYSKIEMLEQYASVNNAIVTNFPMLHIQRADSLHYNFMVALPINKSLPNYKEIMFKQMLPNGNFLTSDSLYGGFQKIDELFNDFENYKKDLNIVSPAIPFQSLLTDRRKESDSTKWITKFYYPIF